MSLTLDLSKFTKLSEGKLKTVVSKTMIDLSQSIISDTPVDSGRLKGNWFPDINGYDDSQTDTEDKIGGIVMARVNAVFNGYKVGDKLTMSNNLPYSVVAEYGLWGKGKSSTNKTVGGFSAKAPKGMVRLNLLKFQKFVDENARKLK